MASKKKPKKERAGRAKARTKKATGELTDEQLNGVAGGIPIATAGGSAGGVLAFPDVCQTPSPGGPVPIPYPNVGSASGGTKKTKITGSTAGSTTSSSITSTSGDEEG